MQSFSRPKIRCGGTEPSEREKGGGGGGGEWAVESVCVHGAVTFPLSSGTIIQPLHNLSQEKHDQSTFHCTRILSGGGGGHLTILNAGKTLFRYSIFITSILSLNSSILPDDCVSWEELSCRADGEEADVRVAARLELMSVSSDHIWIPGLLEVPTGLGRLLELWLDIPLGLGGPLVPSEVPPAADPAGDENCNSLRLVVRKLVLMRGRLTLNVFTSTRTTLAAAKLWK